MRCPQGLKVTAATFSTQITHSLAVGDKGGNDDMGRGPGAKAKGESFTSVTVELRLTSMLGSLTAAVDFTYKEHNQN